MNRQINSGMNKGYSLGQMTFEREVKENGRVIKTIERSFTGDEIDAGLNKGFKVVGVGKGDTSQDGPQYREG